MSLQAIALCPRAPQKTLLEPMRLSLTIPLRLAARLRCRYPLLFFLPGLIAGQSAAYAGAALDASYFSLFATLLAVVVLVRCWSGRVTIGLAAGLVSAAAAIASTPQAQLMSDKSYLVRVLAEPQRPRVGQVRLVLSALGEYSSNADSAPLLYARPLKLNCKAVDLPWKNAARQGQGALFLVRAQFHSLHPPLYPFSYDATLFRHGYSATCKIVYAAASAAAQPGPLISRLRSYLKTRMYEVLGDNGSSGLALAMAIGVRDAISEPTEDAFKRTGLAHLLVASGYQVTLLFCSLCWFLRFVLSLFPCAQAWIHGRTLILCAGMCVSVLFVALVGLEGSVLRALFAILFTLSAQLFDRGTSFANSILLSFLLVALVWPGCYFEPGIQLTFSALWGLASAVQSPGESMLVSYLRACLLACLATSTVALAWFGRFSLWSFLLNPVFAPLGSLLGCKGVLCALLLYICGLDSAGLLLRSVAKLLEFYARWVEYLADFPAASLELEGWQRWTVLACLVMAWTYSIYKRLRAYSREYNLEEEFSLGNL